MNIRLSRDIGMVRGLTIFQQLGMILKSGMPLLKGLSLMEQQASRADQEVLRHLRTSVGTGHTLAEALQTSPQRFPQIAIRLVESGELSGTLAVSLDAIARYLRKSLDLRRKIRSAVIYPAFIIIAVIGLGIAVGTYILPRLIPLFETMKVTLPLSTRILLGVAAYLNVWGIATVCGIVTACMAFSMLVKWEPVKPLWHGFLLRLPFIGEIQRDVAIEQMSSTLCVLLQSGLPIIKALPSAANVLSNVLFRNAVTATIPMVESGNTFSDAIKTTGGKLLPPMALAFLEMGEETGMLTVMLNFVAEYYESEVEYAVKNLTIAIEPALLLVIGVVVGWMVLAIINPIYAFTNSINH